MNDIIRFLVERSGLLFNEDKFQKAAAFVSNRMRIVDKISHGKYLEYLKSSQGPDELKLFIAAFSVGETYFFRNPNHWQAFRKVVVPRILKLKNTADRHLRFWSAGCSTGEEPYTLAICLFEELGRHQTWDIQIMATDINREALAKARKGLFSKYSFRGVKIDILKNYFDTRKGQYRIEDRFRQMVDFSELCLISEEQYPADLKNMDVIFCRNVLMYLRPDIAQNTIKKLAGCLNDNGFLFLGHAEGNLAPRDTLKPIACCNTFVFQKKYPEDKSEELAKNADLPLADMPTPVALRAKNKKRPLKGCIGTQSVFNKTIKETKPKKPDLPESEICVKTENYSKALNHYFQEDFEKALSLLINDTTEDIKSLRELVLICLNFYNRSDLSRAEAYRRQAHGLSKIAPEVYALEAMIKEAAGDVEGALKANQNAVFLDKNFFAPHFALGFICETMGYAAKARRHFANALKILETDDVDRVRLFCGTGSKQLLAEICKRRLTR